jgi:hypothetical protein
MASLADRPTESATTNKRSAGAAEAGGGPVPIPVTAVARAIRIVSVRLIGGRR